MRKLRQFQDLGHEVTFLIGSYTALVGDPSDKNKARPILTEEQVAENSKTYTEQAFRVLDREKTIIRYNGEWLSELSLVDLIRLGQNFTVQQFLARENFANRLEKNEPIFLHETFYALMQGYDAVALKTDIQVGGSDQLFNIIVAGRKLQEALGQKPLVGVITGILPGTDGTQRMSKSTGNIVPINTGAADMFGKVMSIPDMAMGKYMRLVSRWTPHEIEVLEKDVASGALHPRDAKMKLAHEIVSIFYSEADAGSAQEAFVKVYKYLDHFKGDASFYTWLYRIAVNTAKKALVDLKRDPIVTESALAGRDDDDETSRVENELSDGETPDAVLASKEIAAAVNSAIEGLSDDLRQAITLREIEGLSYEEIAELMNCPIGTVRSRIFRAREAVALKLRPLLDIAPDRRW